MTILVKGTDYRDPVGAALREAMEAEMRERYADRLARLAPELRRRTHTVDNDQVVHVAVAYADGTPAGHALLRRLNEDLELKRMYVAPPYRGTGVSRALLADLEEAAQTLKAPRLILQTGDRQPDAVRLYEREGWTHIPTFPPYDRLSYSICMQKTL